MHKKIMITLFALMLVLFPVITLVSDIGKQTQPFSENENRYLQKFPAVNTDNISDKSFMMNFEEYFADRFLNREGWIKVKNKTDKVLGKTEINGVFTVGDQMVEAWKEYDVKTTDDTINAINNFAARHYDVPCYFMMAPTAQDVYARKLPENSLLPSQKSYIKYVYDNLTNVTGIDIYSHLVTNRNSYIYYRTDHHWTSFGAYLAYSAAAKTMNYSAYSLNSFNIEHASNSFRGTLFSLTLDDNITPDTIDFYTLSAGEPNVNITVNDGAGTKISDSMYYRDYLEKKDKYSAFLGTNSAVTTIQTELDKNISKGSLLVFKDSYANSLIPFLSKNYSTIVMIDMRYINVNYEELVNVSDFSQVLFMYNVSTFSDDADLKKIDYFR